MNAGTIFVLCLAAAFFTFIAYLAILGRRIRRQNPRLAPENQKEQANRTHGASRHAR